MDDAGLTPTVRRGGTSGVALTGAGQGSNVASRGAADVLKSRRLLRLRIATGMRSACDV